MTRRLRRGATSIEYAIIVAFVVLVLLVAAWLLSAQVHAMWADVAAKMPAP